MAKKHRSKSHFRQVGQIQSKPEKPSQSPNPVGGVWQRWLRVTLVGFLTLLPWLRSWSISQINPVMTPQFYALLGFSVVWLAVWLIGYWKGYWCLPKGRWLWVVGFWWLASTLAVIFSLLPWYSLWGSYSEWANGYIYSCIVMGLALAAYTLEWSAGAIRQTLTVFLISLTGMGLWATKQAFALGWHNTTFRIDGPLLNADYWLSYGFLFWPLTLSLSIFYLRQKNWRFGLPALLSTIIIGTGLFYALPKDIQRFSHIPGPVEIARTLVGPKIPVSTPLAPPTSSTPTVSASPSTESASSAPSSQEKVSELRSILTSSSNTERFTEWRMGIQLGKWYPWHGTGQGMMDSLRAKLIRNPAFSNWSTASLAVHPHNETIEEFAQKGVPGVVAYLVLWLGLFSFLWCKRRQVTPELKPYWWGMYFGLLLYWLYNQVLFTIVPSGVTSWFMAALLLTTVLPNPLAKELQPWQKYLATVGSVVFTFALVWTGWWGRAYWQADLTLTSVWPAIISGDSLQVIQAAITASDLIPREADYANLAGRSAYRIAHNKDWLNMITPSQQRQIPVLARFYTQRAVLDDPYSPEYRMDYGLVRYIYSEKGTAEKQAGEEDMKQAIREMPTNPRLYATAADAYVDGGNLHEAEGMLEKAYELYPSQNNKDRLAKLRSMLAQ